MSIKGVIFDMDGTIIHNYLYHVNAWLQVCKELGLNKTEDEVLSLFGKTNAETFFALLGYNLPDNELQYWAQRKEIFYRDGYKGHVEPINGLIPFLDFLKKKGIKTGLATSAPTENVDFVLNEANLKNRFNIITDASGVSKGKPDPEIFLLTSNRLLLEPDQCLVFEDAPLGIMAARAAKMRVISLITTFKKEQLPKADLFINDYTDMENHLNELF